MNKTIEISLDAAASVLPCLESRLSYLASQIEALQADYNIVKTTIAELQAKMKGDELPLANGKFRKRLPKGQGDKLIVELLKALPEGQGLPMAEIVQKTGVKHSTVYRTLSDVKRNKGRFAEGDNGWRLVRALPRPLAHYAPKAVLVTPHAKQ